MGSDLGNVPRFNGVSAEAVNTFEELVVPPTVSPVGYVICVAKRKGVRRLHLTSLCWTFKVQLHLQEVCLLRQRFAPPEDCDQVCHKCWKDGTATAIEDTALPSSSSASSSTSDS